MKNQSEWIKAIQITKDTDLEKPVITYLKKCSKNSRVIAPPYYIDEEFLITFDELRYLADIANASNAFGQSPIFQAAVEGNLVHVKILVLFADNPNAPDEDGVTPICQATFRKHIEIIRILAPMSDNPNVSNSKSKDGLTPIHFAVLVGLVEIARILAPLTDNPNAPHKALGHCSKIRGLRST